MDKELLERALEAEKQKWIGKTYQEWLESDITLADSEYYTTEFEGVEFSVQVDLLEVEDAYVHPSVVMFFAKRSRGHLLDHANVGWIAYQDGRIDA